MLQPTPPPRRLLPRASNGQAFMAARTKARHEKSRHGDLICLGCVTCKAKRRKCDELKPSCSQCLRRRVSCGGYSKEFTWRHEGFENPDGPKPANASARKASRTKPKSSDGTLDAPQPGEIHETADDDISALGTKSTSEAVDSPRSRGDIVRYFQTACSDVAASPNISFSPAEQAADFDLLFLDINAFLEAPQNHFSPRPASRGSVEGNSPGEFTALLDFREGVDRVEELGIRQAGQSSQLSEKWTSPLDLNALSATDSQSQSLFTFYRQPGICDDSPESIALVFNHRTSEVLCIKETPTGNPWRQIVWPLAKEHPALYHAVAAMTCFNSRLRVEGFRHLESSIQKFSLEGNDSMPLEVAVTAALSLSMAQTWYYPRSSNGITYIRKASGLLRQALSANLASRPLAGGLCVGFLANTWLYMDVLTRITCRNGHVTDLGLMAAISLAGREANNGLQVDPLMGCAETLFPLIGRVADIVSRVRRISQKANPPGVVSQAVDLMMTIERWIPPLDLDAASSTDSLISSASDLVQTANAYKWATLLLLYQAVPELPCRLSYSEIAQKVLVFIATVPLSSRAVIFPVLPLMIAGCEATETEDRDWVRNRWQSLTSGNSSGIVDRCLELTLEVWKRCDTQGMPCESCRECRDDAGSLLASPGSAATDSSTSSDKRSRVASRRCSCNVRESSVLPGTASISDDGPSRSNATEHTVKSGLHWLSVMEEWGWEG
ncbi:hypothetical protein ACJZ2D_000586 [Fusarium nematophilum]